MTKQEKTRYKKIASEMLDEINEQLTIFKTMYFDKTVTADALLHLDMIEYRDGNIERLQYERLQLALFCHDYLF